MASEASGEDQSTASVPIEGLKGQILQICLSVIFGIWVVQELWEVCTERWPVQ